MNVRNFFKGQLFKGHQSAFYEISLSVLVATIPTWLIVLHSYVGSDKGYLADAFAEALKNGELLLYAVTIIAPALYAVVKEPPVKGRYFLGTACVIIISVSSFFYPDIRNASLPATSRTSVLSYFLFFLALIMIYYVAYQSHKAGLNPGEAFAAEEDNFYDRYAARRGAENA